MAKDKPKARKSSVLQLNNSVVVNWYQRQTRNARYVRICDQPIQCAICAGNPVDKIIVIASRVFGLCKPCGVEVEMLFLRQSIDAEKEHI